MWLITAVFAFTYLGMAVGRLPGLQVDRSWMALAAACVLLITGTVRLEEIASHIDIGALVLLMALMLVSAQFGFSGVYHRLSEWMARHAAQPTKLLLGVVLLGGGLSALLVNDIVAFALTPLLCQALLARGLDPRPFLLALAMSCNAGSAASLIGNPQNILIGQAGDLAFWDYSLQAAVPALVALMATYSVIWLVWRRRWWLSGPASAPLATAPMTESLRYKPLLAAVALLVLFSTPLPREWSALAVALVLMMSRRVASHRYTQAVDWNLLLLFVGLFIVTGSVASLPEASAVVNRLLGEDGLPSGAWSMTGIALMASNVIGNVPFVVLLLGLFPGLPESTLVMLAVMSTLAGNLLLIGSVVNLIVAEGAKRHGVHLGFVAFTKVGVPVTLLSMLAAALWFTLR
ncbi:MULTISPECIES: SLC13 family permease [Halomonadaceae]|jgi:Na+/H+ antiporter NhaD/arsenite permease-like protein|uniref:SLC13 family permease n=1 Tax=Halomonadaceae TaxID=28256 RepID=UPI00111B8740|nr:MULTISPECIES: SLC13 family permease [Halomonas]MCG7578357.1 citrate transporter [Halomonas sp. MMH1-48]MCG7592265.1 citrate transporter [Halomonas sp. McD50-5]MCG7605469.1 citrate transporter [Halomonas sp. MM17-34]MCG7614639.1 citrate transporter [Halomonas sp. MM17-29]MCG7618311.1 citrate transporter [Halomonas sp. McD50-4]